MLLNLGLGMFGLLRGTLGTVIAPPEATAVVAVTAITPFLLLHAFANGTSALTGVEAISNGITAFKNRAAATQASPSCGWPGSWRFSFWAYRFFRARWRRFL